MRPTSSIFALHCALFIRVGRVLFWRICPTAQVTVFYKKTVFSIFFVFVPLKNALGCVIIDEKNNAHFLSNAFLGR